MINEKICYANNLDILGEEYCITASEIFNNKSFCFLLERFSNIMCKKDHEYYLFLNTYFNDEGYVDIWRIPHLLLDLVTGNCKSHSSLLNDPVFRTRF